MNDFKNIPLDAEVKKCFVVRVNNSESSSPVWKWHAACTIESLMRAVGDFERLDPPTKSEIFKTHGNWRMKYAALEVNVFYHS